MAQAGTVWPTSRRESRQLVFEPQGRPAGFGGEGGTAADRVGENYRTYGLYPRMWLHSCLQVSRVIRRQINPSQGSAQRPRIGSRGQAGLPSVMSLGTHAQRAVLQESIFAGGGRQWRAELVALARDTQALPLMRNEYFIRAYIYTRTGMFIHDLAT
jgi:hypothetical protein